MVGTILSNFWAALIAFSFYFFSSYPFLEGMSILIDATIFAIIFFLLTFIARAIIAYVMEGQFTVDEEIVSISQENMITPEPSSEELAKIVKSMLNEQ